MGNPQTIGFNPYMFSNSQMPYGMPNYGDAGDFYNMMFNGYMAQMQGQTNKSSSAGTNTVSEETKQAQLQARKQEQELLRAKGCHDGKDDGKIGFWGAAKNIGKGCVKLFTNMFMKDGKFSLGRTLKTLAVTAAAVGLTVATGGAAAPFLIAAGVAAGGFQLVGGIVKAAGATTDAQAAAGWQDIGSGALGVGLSIAGAKGALKMAGKTPPSNIFKATGDCFKISGQGVKSAWENKGAIFKSETYTNAWATAKTNVSDRFSNIKAVDRLKNTPTKKYENYFKKLDKRANEINAELTAKKISPQEAKIQFNKLIELEKNLLERLERSKREILRPLKHIFEAENEVNKLAAKIDSDKTITLIQRKYFDKIIQAKKPQEVNAILIEARKKINSDADMKILYEAWNKKSNSFRIQDNPPSNLTKTERIIFNKAKYYDGSKSPSNYAIPSLATNDNWISEAQKTAYAQSALAKSKEAETAANNATNPFTLGYDPVTSYFGQYQQALAQNGYMT